MNRRKTMLRTRFGPETRFEVAPNAVAPFRAAQDAELEKLKARLLRTALIKAQDVEESVVLRRAANEAAAVAWATPFPLLFLPTLFEEKQTAALRHAARQRSVRMRTRDLIDLVA